MKLYKKLYKYKYDQYIIVAIALMYVICDRCICKNNILCRILDLQKDRYFEMLAAKYWNQTLKTQCPNSDENEGITLESLG